PPSRPTRPPRRTPAPLTPLVRSATWDDWRRDIGLPDSELGIGADSIIDPRGDGPRIWFHVMPDAKVVKNRLHLDIHASGGAGTTDRKSTRLTPVTVACRMPSSA